MEKQKFDRYTQIKDDKNNVYIFDKYIFLTATIIMLVVALFLIFSYGGLSSQKNFYVHCGTAESWNLLNGTVVSYCKNPLYHEWKYCNNAWTGACEQETLPQGFTYGTPPPKFLNWFNTFAIVLMIVALLLNHLLYNRNYKWGAL